MICLTSTESRRALLVYWTATAVATAELAVGGLWDVLRLPLVRDVVVQLGYPEYFLVILGAWKIAGAATLLAPRLPRLKEWAYAGVVFTDTGAMASHIWKGYGLGEVPVLAFLLTATLLSWATRPASRRL